MPFSRVLLTRKREQVVPTFTWLEGVAIPFALSLMEAQPPAMVLALGTVLVSGNSANAPLGVGQLALLQLGLLWWAMALAFFQARGHLRVPRVHALLRLGSLFVAWLVFTVPHVWYGWSSADDVLVPCECLYIFWIWHRSLSRARLGFAYETIAASFKICLGILLGLMILALMVSRSSLFLSALEASLTVFFVCGLVALSLTRLGILRQVRSVNGKQADPTRTWLAALTLFSGLLIALVFLLEAVFSYSSVLWLLGLLQPLWNTLGTLIGWVLYALAFFVLQLLFALLSWLFGLLRGQDGQHQTVQAPTSPLTHPDNVRQPGSLPPELFMIGRWIVLAGVGLVLVFLIRATLRRWFLPYDAEQLEEIRERLDRRTLRKPRREPRKRRREGPALDLLPQPESARAWYRLFLHTTTTASPSLARQPAETPLEYEQRLRPHLGGLQPPPSPVSTHPPGEAVLHELTESYVEERYGHQPLSRQRQTYLRHWMTGLIQQMRSVREGERGTEEGR